MKSKYRQPDDPRDVHVSSKGMIVDFSKLKGAKLTKNLEYCKITGTLLSAHALRGNIIRSEVIDFNARKVDWRSRDIKDSLIKKSIFYDSNLSISALMNDIVIDTQYEKCNFYDSTFTDTTFENVVFSDCDLSSLVIKRCNFINCSFNFCKTSNKLLENCSLEKTYFSATDIHLETILENFGVTKDSILKSNICIDEIMYSCNDALPIMKKKLETAATLVPLERFNLAYFMTPDFQVVHSELDDALNIKSWLPICKIPSTLNVLLSSFTSFLINQYESDKLPISPLLRLYLATTNYAKRPTSDPYLAEFQANWMAVSMRLLPYFESHLAMVDEITKSNFPSLKLIVEGPIDKKYYSSFLDDVLHLEKVRVEKVVRRNSPADLWLLFKDNYWMAVFVSILLSSRIRIEIQGLRNQPYLKNNLLALPLPTARTPKKTQKNNKNRSLIGFDVGPDFDLQPIYRLHLFALFPEKLSINLQLDLKLGLIYRFRKIFTSQEGHRK